MLSDPLPHAIWEALITYHRHLAHSYGQASRYPAAMAPFGAVADNTRTALLDLLSLLAPAESIYLLGDRPPTTSGLCEDGLVPSLQMIFPERTPLPVHKADALNIVPLTCDHALEMLALTTTAFPGFFRRETCRMGRYWGIRDAYGALIAMGGERLILAPPGQPVWREISGLCTHPSHAGKGLGTALLGHILAEHRAEGSRSWLHVTEANLGAIALYHRVGFTTQHGVQLHRMRRTLP